MGKKENIVPAIYIEGSNYVPVRTVADMLGAEVEYDRAMDTVILKTAEK